MAPTASSATVPSPPAPCRHTTPQPAALKAELTPRYNITNTGIKLQSREYAILVSLPGRKSRFIGASHPRRVTDQTSALDIVLYFILVIYTYHYTAIISFKQLMSMSLIFLFY